MAEERAGCGSLDDAILELGLLSSASSGLPKTMCLREKLEQLRMQSRAALQPSQAWNLGEVEASALGSCKGVSQGQENELDRNQWLNLAECSPKTISRLGLDLCSSHRGSCPGRLAQLSANSHRQHHLKPYNIPWRREERVRTKSENADVPDEEPKVPILVVPSTPLFRSRSLEDVRSPSAEEDLDDMSLEIQRLHVNE